MPDHSPSTEEVLLEGEPDLSQLWQAHEAAQESARRTHHTPEIYWLIHTLDWTRLARSKFATQTFTGGELRYALFGTRVTLTGEQPALWPDHAPRLVIVAGRRSA